MTDNNNNNLPFAGSTHSRTGGGFLLDKERTLILRALGRCDSCGRKTHTILQANNALLVPLTNDDVYQGCCIACNPIHFPSTTPKKQTGHHHYSANRASGGSSASFRLVDKMKIEAI